MGNKQTTKPTTTNKPKLCQKTKQQNNKTKGTQRNNNKATNTNTRLNNQCKQSNT